MATELPIACSLSGSELDARRKRWRALADRALIDASLRDDGVAVQRYRPDSAAISELEELIALEGECCAFLDLELTRSPDQLVLEVSGPPGAAETVAAFARTPGFAG